jgi:hypothetical protein
MDTREHILQHQCSPLPPRIRPPCCWRCTHRPHNPSVLCKPHLRKHHLFCQTLEYRRKRRDSRSRRGVGDGGRETERWMGGKEGGRDVTDTERVCRGASTGGTRLFPRANTLSSKSSGTSPSRSSRSSTVNICDDNAEVVRGWVAWIHPGKHQ